MSSSSTPLWRKWCFCELFAHPLKHKKQKGFSWVWVGCMPIDLPGYLPLVICLHNVCPCLWGKGDLHIYTMALGMYVAIVGCIWKENLVDLGLLMKGLGFSYPKVKLNEAKYLARIIDPTTNKECVPLGLAIYIRKFLKTQLWKLKYFTMAKYNLQKIL